MCTDKKCCSLWFEVVKVLDATLVFRELWVGGQSHCVKETARCRHAQVRVKALPLCSLTWVICLSLSSRYLAHRLQGGWALAGTVPLSKWWHRYSTIILFSSILKIHFPPLPTFTGRQETHPGSTGKEKGSAKNQYHTQRWLLGSDARSWGQEGWLWLWPWITKGLASAVVTKLPLHKPTCKSFEEWSQNYHFLNFATMPLSRGTHTIV